MRERLSHDFERGRMFGDGPWDADEGMSGRFHVMGPQSTWLRIVATDGTDPEADGWEHVSVSTARRIPTWDEMCFIKDAFWEPEEAVFQLHPPESEYVNNHPYVLHLWRNKTRPVPLPPSTFVGVKGETYKNKAEAAAAFERAIRAGLLRGR